MNDVDQFLSARSFAVAGASEDRNKYGNIVFRKLLSSGRRVAPVNPNAESIEGQLAYGQLNEIPEVPEAVSIVTPPLITAEIVDDAIAAGVKHLWMQPGAENPTAGQYARQRGLNVIDDGRCILVEISRRNDPAAS